MSVLSTFNIGSRRYLGNKTKLLPFILKTTNLYCKNIKSVADIFSGTGSVANIFCNNKKIITNDILQSNYLCNFAWFGSQYYDQKKIEKILKDFNAYDKIEVNYMSDNFSNTYFSDRVCSKIGFIRENIEQLCNDKEINKREMAILITSLIYAMDKIAATCGHYDAYRKGAQLANEIFLAMPLINNNLNLENQCFNMDANELVKKIYADLVYIDPPYNSRQYCDAYHLLENVATWKKPKIHGVARKMDRTHIKSKYCNTSANDAFIDLIKNINAKYILLSYNNMATKGNDRSNARISDEIIMDTLKKKGKVRVFSQDYKIFNTGKTNIKNNAERLFLCKIN